MGKIRKMMKKLKSRRIRLRAKMYMLYFASFVVPIMIIGILLVVNINRTLDEHYTDILRTENSRVRTLMSQITTQAYNISNEICYDNTLKNIVTVDYQKATDFIEVVNNNSRLDNLIYNYTSIEGIYIYTDNPTIHNYKQYTVASEEEKSQEWYRKAIASNNIFWASIKDMDENGYSVSNLSLVRSISFPNSSYKAIVVIKLEDDYIRQRISSNIVDAISLDNSGIVYSSNRSWYEQKLPVEIDYDDSYYTFNGISKNEDTVYYTTLTTMNLLMTNSKLYVCTLDGNSYYELTKIMNICILILCLAVLIPTIILFIYTNRFTKRVYLLRGEMHKASRGDYNMRDSLSGKDELTDAFEDLQTMVKDIKKAEAKMYEAELNEKELRNNQQLMEYKMLASQINPHYLYNTLETIRMKALTMGNKEVADSIKILGKTLQYVFKNTGTTQTTLNKEIEHVENYLAIQKLRFGSRINYTMEIDEGLEVDKYSVLPLLLQPIVENAVIHGLEYVNEEGRIGIKICKDEAERLEIRITDNGKGMQPEELKEVQQKLRTPGLKLESSIGIYNICERIRLHYGTEYGLQIESEYEKGTETVLTLPIIEV